MALRQLRLPPLAQPGRTRPANRRPPGEAQRPARRGDPRQPAAPPASASHSSLGSTAHGPPQTEPKARLHAHHMVSAAARIEPAWPRTLADGELPETMSWPSHLPAPHRDLGGPRDASNTLVTSTTCTTNGDRGQQGGRAPARRGGLQRRPPGADRRPVRPELAAATRDWIAPFRASFADVHMETVELIAEGDKVVGRFTCSATHRGAWLGQAPTGRRFERVDEVWIFRFRDGKIVHTWSLEDTLGRLRQLGLTPSMARRRPLSAARRPRRLRTRPTTEPLQPECTESLCARCGALASLKPFGSGRLVHPEGARPQPTEMAFHQAIRAASGPTLVDSGLASIHRVNSGDRFLR
jgi:ketosteroid isomerase-like protein